MYYKSQVEGVARISPRLFGASLKKSVLAQLKQDFEGNIDKELGRVISILNINQIGEGVIIPGDGAAYYKTNFTVLHYIPEVHEVVEGDIKDIAGFGAFIDFGPFEGLVHVSQTMDDFVSFSKQGALTGKESKHTLKIGDKVIARIVAVSFRDIQNPKIGLTMRQPYLGKPEWILEQTAQAKKLAKKQAKKEAGTKK